MALEAKIDEIVDEIRVGVGKGEALPPLLYYLSNGYWGSAAEYFTPQVWPIEYRMNHTKSVCNFWLEERAEDGSDLLHRIAESDVIVIKDHGRIIKNEDAALKTLQGIHENADPEIFYDAMHAKDADGNTPYDLAVTNGYDEIAELLSGFEQEYQDSLPDGSSGGTWWPFWC